MGVLTRSLFPWLKQGRESSRMFKQALHVIKQTTRNHSSMQHIVMLSMETLPLESPSVPFSRANPSHYSVCVKYRKVLQGMLCRRNSSCSDRSDPASPSNLSTPQS